MAVLSFLFGGNELNLRRTRVLRLRFRLWSHCLVGRLGVRSSRFLLCRSELPLTSTPINDSFGRRHGRIPVDKFGAGRAIQIVLASGRAKKARSSEIGKPRRVCMRDSFTLFE